MKIQILSDLHIENNQEYRFDLSGIDLCIMAGDIFESSKENCYQWLVEKMGKFSNIPVIYILGNHEFYDGKYPDTIYKAKEQVKGSNIHILENDMITINGVNFLGCTLWTDFTLFGDPIEAGRQCRKSIPDFCYNLIEIGNYGSKMHPEDAAYIHKESVLWLKNMLQKLQGETNIVITHHAPSMQSVGERYKKDITSSAFASHLDDIILQYTPTYWIHGHMHQSLSYWLGKTRVLCNPLGICINKHFKKRFIIEI